MKDNALFTKADNYEIAKRKHLWVKGIKCFNKDHSILKKRKWGFRSPNQCYDIFHRFAQMFELVSQVSDIAHGPLLFQW